MQMRPMVRRLALTTHVTSSVGWFGAVAGFLALAVVGLRDAEAQTVRAAYIGMELLGWFVIVPFALTAFVTGVVQSLGTRWGLFRHYWVVVKLSLTVAATAVLMLHMRPTSLLADVARQRALAPDDLSDLRLQLVVNAIAALAVLLLATALAVYKPRGLTPYGDRRERESRVAATGLEDVGVPAWVRLVAIGVGVLVLVFLAVHLAGGGLGRHGH